MKIQYILSALLCICLLIAPAAAAGGAGTASNPYIIQTPAELQSVQNDLSAYYVLGNDINMDGVSFTPIGSTAAPFFGSLDGQGYTISNLNINLPSTQNVGLFGVITAGTTIKNLKFADCTISGASYTAVLIGRCIGISGVSSQMTIDNIDMSDCTATSSGNSVGNVIGGIDFGNSNVQIRYCTVENCVAESTSGNSVGNIAGGVANGPTSIGIISQCEVISCHAKASGNAVGNVAGAVVNGGGNGTIQETVVENCVAESTSGLNVGNIAGSLAFGPSSIGWVKNCHVENCISTSGSYVGNVVGAIAYNSGNGNISDCTVENCTVKARSSCAGGIAGCSYASGFASIENCAVANTTILASNYAGGICSTFTR